MSVVLEVDAVTIARGGRVVVDARSLAVAAGEVVAVVGENGCGKSTLLQAIAGVLEPRAGSIAIGDARVWGTRAARQRARARLGYVPEHADAPGFLVGAELWNLCAAARGVAGPSAALRAALGLDALAEVALERMSLGQRRRACLGAALLGPPALLVLDEPDNGLDAERLDALVAVVRDYTANGGATILASHDAAWLDRLAARRIAM